MKCNDALPEIQETLSIIGDVNNDGWPDVAIEAVAETNPSLPAVGLQIFASDVTIRGLRLQNFTANPDLAAIGIQISAFPGASVANVSILGNEVIQLQGGEKDQRLGVSVEAIAESGQEAHVDKVMISGNLLKGTDDGINIGAGGDSVREGWLTLNGVTVIGNGIEEFTNAGINIGSTAKGAILASLNVVDNQINAANAEEGILLEGGEGPDASRNLIGPVHIVYAV